MKKLVLAAALIGVATFASAGTIEAPIMEPTVVIETVEEEAGTSNGILLPLIIIALIAAAASA